MRQVKRWRYYCDFCKKAGGQKYYIEKHERGCTANPNRICGLCEHSGELQPELNDLTSFIDSYCADLPKTKYEWDEVEQLKASGDKLDPMLKKLEGLANYCPACTLAALRQAETETWSNFNFKTKLEAWWAEENASREPEYY